ncbi:MAG: phosphopentomutase [Phascolarctobacterium sp.]|nr:phosphopentomutase [Phascolarctobacterium sp.]
MSRTIILLMDSFGIGYAHDAASYGDKGADTLGHICQWFKGNSERPLYLPNLAKLGLEVAAELSRGKELPASLGAAYECGAYTYAEEVSKGKDTLSGHWEISGVPVDFDWGYFPEVSNCFPKELVDALIKEGNLPGVLGERHASGTQIIEELGEEHVRTGKPIIYTSADSVLQIAAHEEAFGLERLYELCKLAFKLVQPYKIARVIARPFVGTCAKDYSRTTNRHDYAVPAPKKTLLDKMVESGGNVYAVGKIADIFAHRGITKHYAAGGLDKIIDATKQAIHDAPDNTLVFANFVDFDSSFGHRRDVEGYGKALEHFDSRLPEILELFQAEDLILITADHGNDPTWEGTDHTREKVPVLFFGGNVKDKELAPMQTFADMGQTIASFMNIEPTETGTKADLF